MPSAPYVRHSLSAFSLGNPAENTLWRNRHFGEIAGQIARQKGLSHMSAQAVGGAVGRNRISLMVPCHRVVGGGGNLTGYAGGIDKKSKLLAMEKAGRAL